MILSRLSLTGKLFVAVVLPVLFALILMAGAVAWSMRSGFSQYLLDAEIAQFETLQQSLESHPQAEEGWPELSDFRAWVDLIEQNVPPMVRPPMGSHAFGAPPHEAGGRGPPRLPDRLALYDPNDKLIAGIAVQGASYTEKALHNGAGKKLGSLRLSHLGATSAPADAAFLSHQFKIIALTAILALLCASAVAWGVAQQSLASIRRIGDHVARLAAGDLDSRLNSPRRDELGRMMRNHDALAEHLGSVRARERQWISDTSHELKTPLAVLRAQIEAMQDGIRPTTAETLDSMHHAVMRLSRLTDDLSLLSRSDEGRLLQPFEPVSLCELLHDAARDVAPKVAASGLTLDSSADETLIVAADPVRLRQVIDNLLDNSCRYTDAPGHLTLRCDKQGEMAVITVCDTAPCPPAASLPELFDRFRRAETSRARSHGGSGLGLAICRSLIEAHGGTITAHPSERGGLCIRVQLPLS